MPRATALKAVALAALAATPALADEKDDKIERLEREMADMRREIAEMKKDRVHESDVTAIRAAVDDYLARNPGVSGSATYIGPGGVRRPGGAVTLGGYFSTDYIATEYHGKEPSFVDMRLVPQIHADVTQSIAFNAEIEFEHGGVSDEIDGEIAVEYAELTFRCSDAFTFKAGTLLVPFGAFNQSHDDPLNDLATRPLVARWVVPSAFSAPGIGGMGAVDVTEEFALHYDVILCNGFSDNFDSEEGTRGARTLFEEDDNHDKTVFGRVGASPQVPFLDVLGIGASGAIGKIGEQSDSLHGFGFDANAKSGPWEFKGEYDQFGVDRESGAAPPIDPSGELGPVRGLHGWYAQILYRVTEPWVRSLPFAEKDASLAFVLRRDSVDLNDRVHGASEQDDERAWTAGVTYRPTSKTAIKIEYRHASSGAQGSLGADRDVFAIEFATYF